MAALGFDAMKADATAGHTAFLRKGVSGGWREHFSESDERAVMEMTAARLPKRLRQGLSVGFRDVLNRWRASHLAFFSLKSRFLEQAAKSSGLHNSS